MSDQSQDVNIPQAVYLRYPMDSEETQIVNIDGAPLANPSQTNSEVGISLPTVAKIQAAGHLFSVLDVRKSDSFSTPLVVVDASYKERGKTGYKGLRLDDPLVVGRSHHQDRFNYGLGVSRNHFSLAYSGLGLIVANLKPSNKTLLSGDLDFKHSNADQKGIVADFTKLAEEDMDRRHDAGPGDIESPHGYYKNHPIIGRKSLSVKNGVYFTVHSEAVVVDDKSKTMQQAKQGLLASLERKHGRQPTLSVETALKMVNDYTRKILPYNAKITDRLSQPLYEGNKLIGLSEYIQSGGGVCRHQCLVAAFLAESLVEKGILIGQVGVERNHDIDEHGAHAWAVFKTQSGQSIVIDPAQGFVGTKDQAHRERRWKYDLPVQN